MEEVFRRLITDSQRWQQAGAGEERRARLLRMWKESKVDSFRKFKAGKSRRKGLLFRREMIRYASGETPVSGRDVQVLHPLDPLTVEEIRVFKDVLVDAGLAGERTAFTYVGIREPAKEEVLAYNDGDEIPRIVSALLFEAGGHQPRTVLVDVSNKIVLKHQEMDPSIEGQGPILKSEYELAERLVKSDSAWLDAMARRGLHDLDTVKTVPLSAGVFGYDDEVGNRVLRVLAFEQKYPTDSMWAHPIDGVVAHIDTTNERVLRVIDTGHTNVPQESGDYNDEAVRGPFRTTLKPIHITQPEGVSFQLKGQQLTLGELVSAGGLQRPRGTDAPSGRLRRRRLRASHHLQGVHL
ncbi:hypothetical protein AAHB34_20785 [Paenarthrobacter ureafaciens]